MFLPYLIALILGLVNPADSSTSKCHGNSQVQTQDSPGDDGGTKDGDTGGETGQTPPPKIGD